MHTCMHTLTHIQNNNSNKAMESILHYCSIISEPGLALKLKIDLPQEPAMPLLDIYTKDSIYILL